MLIVMSVLFIPIIGSAQSSVITINIDLDRNENQTSWTLTGPGGFSESGGTYLNADDFIIETYMVSISGTYTFTIYDSGSNGLVNNRFGDENRTSGYTILVDGSVEYASASSPNFGAQAIHTFDISFLDECDAIVSGNADSDGDGISDICDLDDDNDGILDCEEKGLTGVSVSNVFVLNGNAVQTGDSEVRITENTTNQSGQMWLNGKVDFTKSFSIEMEAYLGTNDTNGADGMAIVFHNSPVGTSANGANGEGLGTKGIQNGIALELDTYTNNFDPGAPSGPDHGQIWDTDNQASITSPISLPNLEDGNWHPVVITWNATTQKFTYIVSGTLAGEYIFTDITSDYFGGESSVYFGFTASTGGYANEQSIRFSDLCSLPLETDTDNDGIPNHLDTDSDNDGCPDAIEAAADIYEYDLTILTDGSVGGSSLNLGTIVDTNPTSSAYGMPIEDVNGVNITSKVPQELTDAVNDETDSDACKADLSLQKDVQQLNVSVSEVQINSEINYLLILTNDGPHPVRGVQVTDNLPTGLINISGSGTVGTFNSYSGVWNLGTHIIGVGETEILTITATVGPDCGSLTNFAEVTAMDRADLDSTSGNNQ